MRLFLAFLLSIWQEEYFVVVIAFDPFFRYGHFSGKSICWLWSRLCWTQTVFPICNTISSLSPHFNFDRVRILTPCGRSLYIMLRAAHCCTLPYSLQCSAVCALLHIVVLSFHITVCAAHCCEHGTWLFRLHINCCAGDELNCTANSAPPMVAHCGNDETPLNVS